MMSGRHKNDYRGGANAGRRVAKAMLVVGILIATAPHGHSKVRHAVPLKWAPPVQYLPLEQVEPSRATKASIWQSPYCTKWHDGCEACERRNAQDPSRCSTTASPGEAATCRRHPIICASVDWDALNEVCAIWKLYTLNIATQRLLLAGQTITHHEDGARNEWARKSKRHLTVVPREEFLKRKGYLLLPGAILGAQKWITLESQQEKWPGLEIGRSHISDYYCQATYQELPPQPGD
jgi:hypothetical protein